MDYCIKVKTTIRHTFSVTVRLSHVKYLSPIPILKPLTPLKPPQD